MVTDYGSFEWPPIGTSGGGINTYPNFASLPSGSADGATGITLDTDTLYIYNLATTTWIPVGSPGAMLAIGTIDTGTPSANGAQDVSNTLVLQSASATVPGLVNTTAQTLAGAKTFSTAPILSSLTASQAVVTDASKNLASLAYTSAATASTLVSRDGSGNSTFNVVSASTLTSTVSTGTAPFTVSSTTQVSNLNAATAGSATTATTATNATNVATTTQSGNTNYFPTFVAANSTSNQSVSVGPMTYNPSSGTLTTTTFVGALTGNASTATTATNATNLATTTQSASATYYPIFVPANSSSTQVVSVGPMSYNPNTGNLTTTTFTGALSGNASTVTTNANLTGPVTSTGNATAIAAGAITQTMTGATATPTASKTVSWDSNKNLSAVNMLEGYTTAATAATATALLVGSNYQQYFTGSTAGQSVTLPVTSGLVLGQSYEIVNASTQTISVQTSAGATQVLQIMASNSVLVATCILTSGTTTASWSWTYGPISATGLPLTNPMNTGGDIIYGGASGVPTRLANGTSGQVATSAGGTNAPTWSTVPGNTTILKAATRTVLTGTGSETGKIFTCSSANATVGATYTNNGVTYTVLATIAAKTTLFCSGTGTLSGGTLTKSGGTGDATITFTLGQSLATYTTPSSPAPISLAVRGVGGGGGGAGSGTGSGSAAGTGTITAFSFNGLLANGGAPGTWAGAGGAGGTASLNGLNGYAISGGSGGTGSGAVTGMGNDGGGIGGSSAFGGAGAPGWSAGSSGAGATNTGGGGGGGGSNGNASVLAGAGGGSGGYFDYVTGSISATFYYCVGAGGGAGGAGTSGVVGGAGGTGVLIIDERYQ